METDKPFWIDEKYISLHENQNYTYTLNTIENGNLLLK